MRKKPTADKKQDTSKPGTLDLKGELQEELKIQFLENLKTHGSLSADVCDALITLLTSQPLTSADILDTLREKGDKEGGPQDE